MSPSISSGKVLTGSPKAFASSPLALARFRMMLRVAVAALEASKPALASVPSRAVVSFTENPKVLATGPTMDIAV